MAVIFGLAMLIKYKEQYKKVFKNLAIYIYFLILALIFGYMLLPNVYIVDNNDYKKRILIGFSSVKLDNGDVVSISGSCVVNNTTRMLYVQSIEYTYSAYSRYNYTQQITPYSVYKGSIDYAFKEPPKKVRTSVLKSSTVRKWLRERTFGEEK